MVGVAGTQIFGADDAGAIDAFVAQTGVSFPIVRNDGSEQEIGWPPGSAPYPRQALVDADHRLLYVASEHDETALEQAIEAALE